jgi:hypothetical protein
MAKLAQCSRRTKAIAIGCWPPSPKPASTLLQEEGAASFNKSWNDLMACIESKSAVMPKAS